MHLLGILWWHSYGSSRDKIFLLKYSLVGMRVMSMLSFCPSNHRVLLSPWASLVAQMVKNLSAMQEN